jgi:hypothetical protein
MPARSRRELRAARQDRLRPHASARLADGTLIFGGSYEWEPDSQPVVNLWSTDRNEHVQSIWSAAVKPDAPHDDFVRRS